MIKRTTIVATLGPATSSTDAIEKLVLAGMSVARLNFSHGSHEEQAERVHRIRDVASRLGEPIACLQDLCGPKIRTGPICNPDGITLVNGSKFILATEQIEGTPTRVSTTYPQLAGEVKPGERILLDDGTIELEIESITDGDIVTRVVQGGILKAAKGINLPGTELSVSALTDKDKKDAEFGLSLDVDYMALSFVRQASDILELRAFLAERGRADMPIIAKIEKPEALENLTEILDVVEGVMVARGDLGVEIPAEEVPMLQKKIIFEAHRRGRIVITATQMLDSMIHNPRPTRAEASDVANAIVDGTDAVMLSGETAVGQFPTVTVDTMSRIARYTESMQDRLPWKWASDTSLLERSSVARAVAKAACNTAEELKVNYLVTFTESGSAARLLSHYRPNQPIIALTPSQRVCRQLALPWGVTPVQCNHYKSIEEMMLEGLGILKEKGLVKTGETAVVILGTTLLPGATDIMKVHRFT